MAGCDASLQGVKQAARYNPRGPFEVCSVYDDLVERFGSNGDVVVSSRVIGHLYDPKRFAGQVKKTLRFGGLPIVTTPYDGFVKKPGACLE